MYASVPRGFALTVLMAAAALPAQRSGINAICIYSIAFGVRLHGVITGTKSAPPPRGVYDFRDARRLGRSNTPIRLSGNFMTP